MDTEILFNPDEIETWFFLPGISVVREREKSTLEQLLVTPISKMAFVIGKIIPYIAIAMLDFI